MIPPEEYCNKNTECGNEKKAGKGLSQSDSDVDQKAAIFHQIHSGAEHPGRTAENERIDPSHLRRDFPDKNKKNQKENLDKKDFFLMPL